MKDFSEDLRDPKFWATICAWMVPVSMVVLWAVGICCGWTKSETGTFIGAFAGTSAGLAGYLYVYATFKQQNDQFKIDQNNQMFFRLLNSFTLTRDRMTYYNSLNGSKDYKDQNKNGDFAFKEIIEHLKMWSIHSKGWPSLTKENFDKRGNDYPFMKFPDDFSIPSSTRNHMKFLFKAVQDEETLGSYLRSLESLIRYCDYHNLGEYLQILESHMGKHERVYLHYYFALIAESDLTAFVTSFKFLWSVYPKHLLNPEHKKILYPDFSLSISQNSIDPENIILD